MATKSIGKVTIRDGKLKRVHKFKAGQRKAGYAKAGRVEVAWKSVSRGKNAKNS